MTAQSTFRLSEADHERVSAAVGAAEAHSAGEIVTIVTDRSDGYTDVALAWAVLAAMTALTVLSIWPGHYLGLYDRLLGDWGSEWTHRGVLALATAFAVSKFSGVMLIQLWQPLKFWLIPGIVKAARVRARAVTCFKVGAERRTHGRTGILIYVSVREHRAEIVADAAIAAKVSPEVWGEAMAAMLGHIRAGRLAEGLVAAVEKVGAGEVLGEYRAEDDTNELPDRLIEV
jgi:putative membrane protein